MKRQHKIAILKYTKGNFWLLLIPLLRGLAAMKFDIYHWLKGSYLDIIVILSILGLACIKWNYVRYEIGEKGITVNKGVVFKSEFVLPYSVVCCAVCAEPLFLRPFKAVKISLDSDSYSVTNKRSKADVALIVSLTDYLQLYNKIPAKFVSMKMAYQASKKDLIFFSLLFSSTLSGIIFMGTFFIQGSRVVGKGFEDEIFSAVSSVAEGVKKITERAEFFSVALTMIILSGWLLSFSVNLLRHLNFRIRRCGNEITIENGHFSKWKYYVNSSRINYADLRQNLFMKIAKIMSVHVSCTGYGKRRNEMPVFVPITTRRRVMSTMKMMLPDFTLSNISLRPKRTYIVAYIWMPTLLVLAVPITALLLAKNYTAWEGAIKFCGVMLEIPSVYLLVVKIAAKMTTGIGVGRETLTVRYCTAFQFHTVIVPKSRVAYIKVRSTPFQRAGGCCDVVIFTRGERVKGHRVRGVRLSEAKKFAANYNSIGQNV
ncbi:MAG: PH domain-containing protein [Oscillospiraceae bacterium]|nr:PH domain-containing protein [Oscillospiraceae bacterium]